MGLVPLRGLYPLVRWYRGLPRDLSHRRFRRSPNITCAMLEHVGRDDVYPVHRLHDDGYPLARVPAIAGLPEVFNVKERRTLACLLSNECDAARSVTSAPVVTVLFDSLQRFAQGIRSPFGGSVHDVSRCRSRGQAASLSVAARCPLQHPSCRIVTDAWLHGPRQSASRNILLYRSTALHLPHLQRAGHLADRNLPARSSTQPVARSRFLTFR
jgi:hypothetical protein